MCALGLAGCASTDTNEAISSDTGLTGGVAATVNGVEIEEDKVTRAINNMRLSNNMTDDDEWKSYLKGQNDTPESMRDEVLGSLIDQQLVLQCAEQRNVTTSDEEIQSYVDKMRANYSSDEAWQTALEGAGFEDEEAYREALRYSILQKKLEEGFEQEIALNDDALLQELKTSAPSYSGSKRSSHILFDKDDKATAEEVLPKIKSGELSFEDAVQQYSKDSGSAANGGDVGWDRLTSFVSEYQQALMELNKGDISDLVESQYGYHIITVTDVFEAPSEITSIDQVPTEFVDEVRTTSTETKTDDALKDWLTTMRQTNDVVINDMPENAPYIVDMSDEYTAEEIEEINTKARDELLGKVAEEEEVTTTEEAVGDMADASGEGTAAEGGATEGSTAEGGTQDTAASDAASTTGTQG